MNNGTIAFDMVENDKPIFGETKYLLKRWTKYSIYAKSGVYNRTENPLEDTYVSSSVYLYDYVIAGSADFYNSASLSLIEKTENVYFETASSYPRNHFTHKRSLFSLYDVTLFEGSGILPTSVGTYKRCSQNITTTIGEDSLEDGSSPVQSTDVGNLNLNQGDNVINK